MVNSNSGSSLMAVIGFFKDQLKDKLESFLNIRYDNSTLQLKVDEEVGTIRLADTLTDVLIPAYDIEHRKLVTFSSHQVISCFNLLHDSPYHNTSGPIIHVAFMVAGKE